MNNPVLGVGGGSEKRKISPEEQAAGELEIEQPSAPPPEIQVEPPAAAPQTEIKETTETPQETVLEEEKMTQDLPSESNLGLGDVGDSPLNITDEAKKLSEEINRSAGV